ncbi:MAG: amidohydrolase [Thermomicrobiales bacterium]|nr:amidohydrolase [Thermomicrobiales bacterium]
MSATTRDLKSDIDEIMPGVIADRRYFHQHPELGFQEFETAKLVQERLAAMGVEDIRTGIAVTGVTGLIKGAKPGGPDKVVLVRADMDALPIHEENKVDYVSTIDGKMHACGHDAHTSMLLGVGRLLLDRRDEFSGTVKLLFQPAEEGGGGARVMIEEGVLEDPPVDLVFGQHVAAEVPVGQVELRPGACMAAADRFEILVKGRGGHGAQPHLTVDPIAIGSQIVSALQTIVAREVDPTKQAVVTVGAFLAGDAPNVIPDTATLRGTLRSFDPEVRELIGRRVGEIAVGIASAMRAEVEYTYAPGYPATINDPEQTAMVREVAEEILGAENVREGELMMGAEDFSYFLEKKPGCFFFTGTRDEEKGISWGHHHPRFDVAEDGMAIGMEVMVSAVLRALNEE